MNIKKLNDLLLSSGIKKSELAALTKLSRTTIDNILNGSDLMVSNLEKISGALNVNPAVFFSETSDVSSHHNLTNVSAGRDIINESSEMREMKIRMEYLEKIIAEKERLIEVLMRGPEKGK